MRRSSWLGTALALAGAIAFDGDALAFGGGMGGGGGHMGGGIAGGGFGGGHMSGGALGAGAGLGGGAPTAGLAYAPGGAHGTVLQTGRSGAEGTNANVSQAQGGAAMGHHAGDLRGRARHRRDGFGGYGAGFEDFGYGYGSGDPYDGTDYSYGYGQSDDGLYSGRSVAEPGRYCATPIRTCTLAKVHPVGDSCSCRVPGGRSGGHVAN